MRLFKSNRNEKEVKNINLPPKQPVIQNKTTGVTKPPIEKKPEKPERHYYKPTITEKLTIIFIENSKEVVSEKDTILKIVKGLVKSGYVCILKYNSNKITKSELLDVNEVTEERFFDNNIEGSNICLYDALLVLKRVVDENYEKIFEHEKEKVKISNVEIIGFGRCIDTCSLAQKETAVEDFYSIASKSNVTTKYFCLTEEFFIDAAIIGFRSIGSIYRNYK